MHYPATFCWSEGIKREEIARCLFSTMPLHRIMPLVIRHECYAGGLDTGPHQHMDFWAFYIVQNGQGIHLIDGHPYTIVRGDVYLLPPGTIHAYQRYHTLEIDAFYFQRQFFSHEEIEALRALPGFWRLFLAAEDMHAETSADYTHRLHLLPERHRIINEMVAEMCAEYLALEQAAALLTHSLFFRLLVSVTRQTPEQKAVKPQAERTYSSEIASILRLCEDRFHEPLTVPQLAALLFLSPNHFSELFTREVGIPPATYLRRLRLERAQTLLRTTTLTITEIAQSVGFSDGPHLTRAFHATFHLTPTAYRTTFGSARSR